MIETEGIRYTGSKKEIIPSILNLIEGLEIKTVLDGFAGTTRVGQAFKKTGYDVYSNDLSAYSKVFAECYLLNNRPISYYVDKVKYLDSLPGKDGWFTQNYGGEVLKNEKGSAVQGDNKKRPWQKHNTLRLDHIREEIDLISEDDIERAVLLTSLINALDKVDNGLGHQVSYLKNWAPRSSNKMKLEVPKLIVGDGKYGCHQSDIFNVKDEYDLVYLDPPYGTNNEVTVTTRVRYASYYHLWSTIVKNDRPSLHGAALRREDVSSDTKPGAISVFESTNYQTVKNSIKDLVTGLNTRYIVFSYNNKSKVKIEDLVDIFSTECKLLETRYFSHKENVQKRLTSNKEWMGDTSKNYEYLFLMERK
jgi:adenine-specific DNA-methyltransferase